MIPIPWDERDLSAGRIDLYRDLIRLKRDHPALDGCGMRWLHVEDDVPAFAAV